MIAAQVNGWRPYRRLPFLALTNAASAKTLPPVSEQVAAMSMAEVMKTVGGIPAAESPRHEFTPRYPISVVALIEELLGIDPRDVASRFFDREDKVAASYAESPEQRAQLGLADLISDAIQQYKVMGRRNVDRIRLMTEEDAHIAKRPNARMANLITVLSAAMHADEQHVICFEPPKAPTANEEELLLAAARLVNADYSLEAFHALELLCDRNVHFGSFDRLPRASELMHAVVRSSARSQP